MADEAFDVIISDTQYQQLKQNKKNNIKLTQTIATLQQKTKIITEHYQSLQKDVAQKDQEIYFLVELISAIGANKDLEQPNNFSTTKSTVFEVLGQSMMEPQLAVQRKKKALNEQLTRKYTPLIKKAAEIEERIESQEELISKLNQMDTQKNQVLLKQRQGQHQDQLLKIKQLEKQIKTLRFQQETFLKNEKELKKQNNQITAEKQCLFAQVNGLKALKDASSKNDHALKQLNQQVLAENQALNKKINDQNLRIKDLEMEICVLKEGMKNNFPKESTKNQIKGLLDQYIREVDKSLRAIPGLTSNEMKGLLQQEMKEIVDYIPKSISRKI